MRETVRTIEAWVSRRDAQYVCVTNVHGLMECQDDGAMRDIHRRAGLVVPDGMPLVWFARLRGRRGVERVYGPDLMLAVCAASVSKGYRHFLYGGASRRVLDLLTDNLRCRFPGIRIAGAYSPPFRALTAEEDRTLVAQINAARADIVWVGVGCPKNERWMASHVGRVEAPVLLGVGAAFDFIAGVKRQAPAWMRRAGLEWLFRLLAEPGRLWKRYVRNNPRFAVLAAMQLAGLRHYD
jgi:N-acetylglucosaminyldiphosphoundecaprenol N-acetyl-beta-D-mannosaminyltransferase